MLHMSHKYWIDILLIRLAILNLKGVGHGNLVAIRGTKPKSLKLVLNNEGTMMIIVVVIINIVIIIIIIIIIIAMIMIMMTLQRIQVI